MAQTFHGAGRQLTFPTETVRAQTPVQQELKATSSKVFNEIHTPRRNWKIECSRGDIFNETTRSALCRASATVIPTSIGMTDWSLEHIAWQQDHTVIRFPSVNML
jgi:hypothetical protein